jgi:hypothetical protein
MLVVLALLCCASCSGEPGRPASARPRQVAEQPFGLKWDGYRHPPRYDADIAAFGGGGTFHELVWCAVETAPGVLYWDLDDGVVGGLLADGYRVMLRIRIGSCWASGRPASPTPRVAVSYPPVDLAAYQAFVRTAVTRYAARGVHVYGIENEIDALNMWGGDPLAYREVGRAGARAVRDADPAARVVDVGVTSGGYGVAAARDLLDAGRPAEAVALYTTFYARPDGRFPPVATADALQAVIASAPAQRVFAAHAADFELDRDGVFDAYQLHYYDNWAAASSVIDYIRAHAGPSLPIEGWEIGSYWPGGDYDPVAHGIETAKLITILLARDTRRIVYLPLYFRPGVVASTEHWRGLYGADDVARPAKTVYDQFRARFATGVWHPVARPGLAGALVDQGATTSAVIWSAGQDVTLPRPGEATVTELPGGHSGPWPDGPLRVGAAPLIVTLPMPYDAALSWLESA